MAIRWQENIPIIQGISNTLKPSFTVSSANLANSCSFSESAQPLTPTRTPTSATFLPTSFETPKLESSFYDPRVTWNTADPYATTPDFLKTPKYMSFTTPSQSPVLGLSRKRPLSGQNIEDKIAAHVHPQSPNPNPSMTQVPPSRHLSGSPKPSSPSTLMTRSGHPDVDQTPTQAKMNQGIDQGTGSADSMQTPPPTSTSASRRKAQQVQTTKVSSGSTVHVRRLSTLTGPKGKKGGGLPGQVDESPEQLHLQFSPDDFAFSMSGSATVPAYPQHKLFWEPNQGADGMSIDFPFETFPLGLEASKNLDPFVSSHQKENVPARPSSCAFDNPGVRHGRPIDGATSAKHESANQADFISSGLMIRNVPKGVNPSLLFSSPSRPLPPSVPCETIPNETLQPYASQLRDAQMDKESGLDRVSKRRRKLYDDSPAVKAALQALREDTRSRTSTEETTDDGVPVRSRAGNTRTGPAASKVSEASRRLGATRKMNQPAHRQASARLSKSRTAVTLTIDENGRAKTETKVIYDGIGSSAPSPEANMEMETDSEDSESTSTSESDEMTISQPQSFAFPHQKAGKPKLARFVTESKTHSQESSYAPTLAPSNVGYNLAVSKKSDRRTSMARLPRSNRRLDSPAKRRQHATHPSTVIADDVDRVRRGRELETNPAAESLATSDEDRGDAQSELKKIVRIRAQTRRSDHAGARKTSNLYPSSGGHVPPELFGAMACSQGSDANIFDDISPTTITDPGLSAPGTGPERLVGEGTRCVCPGFEIEGELMILWYVERFWSGMSTNRKAVIHAKIGYMLDASASIATVFLKSTCACSVWAKHQMDEDGVHGIPRKQLSPRRVHL